MTNSAVKTPPFYDFLPSAQKPDTSMTLDDFILFYVPWGYWKMNESSGHPQDSSGNGRHGTATGAGISYSQSPINSRAGNSVRFTSGRFAFPSPFSRLGALANTWTIGGLFYLEAEVGAGSSIATVNGSSFFGQPGAATASTTSDVYLGIAMTYGNIPILKSGPNTGGHTAGLELNKAMAIFLVGSSVPGVTYTVEVYINGVKFGQCARGNVGNGAVSTFSVGRAEDTGVAYSQMRASNICCWPLELTQAQIIALTQAMMDEASYEAAYTP